MEVTRSATLTRPDGWLTASDAQGNFGRYVSDTGLHCVIGELPWRDNKADCSCVPAGKILMLWQMSPHHKCMLYHMQNVPGRTVCEWHVGNFCGDTTLGYCSDVLGCGIPGLDVQVFQIGSVHTAPMKPPVAQKGVTSSGLALTALEKDMQDAQGNQMPFWVTIQ